MNYTELKDKLHFEVDELLERRAVRVMSGSRRMSDS